MAEIDETGAAFHTYQRSELILDHSLHVLGLCVAAVAVPVLLINSLSRDPAAGVGIVLYGVGLLGMLICSAAYHFAAASPRKHMLRRLDRAAIFVLIAGTYSPVALTLVGGALGLFVLVMVWLGALLGIVLAVAYPRRSDAASLVLYIVMGWGMLVPIAPRMLAEHGATFVWIIIGGGLFTGGVGFHLAERLKYHNVLWHACVLAGCAAHYTAIYGSMAIG